MKINEIRIGRTLYYLKYKEFPTFILFSHIPNFSTIFERAVQTMKKVVHDNNKNGIVIISEQDNGKFAYEAPWGTLIHETENVRTNHGIRMFLIHKD